MNFGLGSLLSSYLTLNVLIVIGFFALVGYAAVYRIFKLNKPSRFELNLHYGILTAILVLAVGHPFMPKAKIFEPTIKLWAADSLQIFDMRRNFEQNAVMKLKGFRETPLNVDEFAFAWSLFASLVFALGAASFLRDVFSLRRIKRSSYRIRKIGRVGIYLNDQIKIPFSYFFAREAAVILPSSLMSMPADFKMAVAHEIQHHRHGDTKWVYVVWSLKLLCIINPLIHLWSRWLSEIQEFACDETLVDQGKVESRAYARCLVEVALTAVYEKDVPACATGLVFISDRNILKRRIEKMMKQQKVNGRSVSVIFGFAIAGLLAGTAYASNGLVQDRRVTLAQAQVMAENVRNSSNFPVTVNELVLEKLNRFIGTQEGRDYMKSSLRKMKFHEARVVSKIRQYHLPIELAAVPIIESGYDNLGETNRRGWGAGIWMFIKNTARTYGLKVNSNVDERLDVDLESAAAMRYLKANFDRFGDWNLALLAYNIGENRVDKAIADIGSRDAWELVRGGHQGDGGYLAKVIAAVLIMKNPQVLE